MKVYAIIYRVHGTLNLDFKKLTKERERPLKSITAALRKIKSV